MKDPTKWSTPNSNCPACSQQHMHTASELEIFHPFSKHGFDTIRWTDVMLDTLEPLELHGEPDPEENK